MLARISTCILVLLVVCTGFVVDYQLLDYALLPRFIFVSVVCLMVILSLTIGSFRARSCISLGIGPITFLLGLWLGATVLSGLVSNLWGEYIFEVGRVSIYFISFLLFKILLDHKFNKELFSKSLIVSSILICSIATYQFFGHNATVSRLGMRSVTGLMSNKNLLSEYLGMLIPMTVFGIWKLKGLWKGISCIAMLWCMTLIVAILARSVWLGFSVTSCVILLVLFLVARIKVSKRSWMGLVAAGLIILTGQVVLNAVTNGVLADRLLSIFGTDSGTAGFRLKIWELTWTMVQESPWTGVGAGNWKIAFQQFGLSKGLQYAVEPLNDYAGIAAETGLLGLLGYAGAIAYASFQLILHLREKTENLGFTVAILAGLVMFTVTSFFSFPLHRIEQGMLLMFFLAFADTRSVAATFKLDFRILIAVILPVLIYTSYMGIVRHSSELNTRKALEAREAHRWQAVIRQTDKVDTDLYPIEPSSTPIAWYRGLANFQLRDVDKARIDFKSAYDVNPYHVHVLNNLATCLHLKGENEAAVELYLKAIDLNDRFPDAVKNLVAVYFNMGMYDDAICIIDESPLTQNGPGRIESELKALKFEVEKHKRKLRKEAKRLRKLENKRLFEERFGKKQTEEQNRK